MVDRFHDLSVSVGKYYIDFNYFYDLNPNRPNIYFHSKMQVIYDVIFKMMSLCAPLLHTDIMSHSNMCCDVDIPNIIIL